MARKLHVRNISLLGLYKLGRAKENWASLAATYEQLRVNIKNIYSTPELIIDHRYYPHIHNCCPQACTVDANGNVIGCSYLREICYYGNIRTSSLLDMWNSTKWLDVRHQKVGGKCNRCELNTTTCGGDCRAAALSVSGRWDEPDPYCWKGDLKRT